MRIRKHARISAPSSSIVADPPSTHVLCELNRSPWDVISFTSLTQEYEFQDKINGDYTCHSVERDSVYASHSIGSKKEKYWAKKVKKEVIEEEEEVKVNDDDDDDEVKAKKKINTKREDMDYICCNKADGKGWHCKNEAKEGQLLCEHHLEQLKTYHYNYSSYKVCSKKSIKVKPEPEVVVNTVAPKTVVAANKKKKRARVSATSPTDFYFYSGFGPSYSTGRKRRAGMDIIKKEEERIVDATNNNTQAASSSSSVVHVAKDPVDNGFNDDDHVVDDFYEDTDDDDDQIEDGKKRIRKPIKARSLKSLL